MASIYPAAYAPGLANGDRMSRAEFHRIYSEMPEDVQAELIGGIVYLASPLRILHGKQHVHLATVLGNYEARTPGVEAADNTTHVRARTRNSGT